MTFVTGGEGELKELFLTDIKLIDDLLGDRLWSFGSNANGALGDNTTTNQSNPVQSTGTALTWSKIGFNGFSTAAIKSDNTLWVWGKNSYGQLGDNSILHRSSPVQTTQLTADWTQVVAGKRHSAAIKTNGELWIWGHNNAGQLGKNDRTHRSSPSQTISADKTWKKVSVGYYHTAAIKIDNTLWVWGDNSVGQLGKDNLTNFSSPVQTLAAASTWKDVACGDYHNLALKTDGTLWAWGQNSSGQLGDDSITKRSSPVQTKAGGSIWKQASCGDGHSAAIKLDGTLWMWGLNDVGQLGTNDLVNKTSPVETVSSGTNWKQVACGGKSTAAIKTDGSLWTWGDASNGKLGDNSITNKSSPVQTSLSKTNWKQVSCGNTHIAAVTNGD
jgi:alpha-tubulin suppressor-like RCC1 family protein